MKILANFPQEYCFDQAAACSTERRWWLFPHFLGLDAVAVAVVWQAAAARCLSMRTEWSEIAALALCVFSIYLGDRLRDSYSVKDDARPRHRFVLQHRSVLTAVFILVFMLGAGVAVFCLPRTIFVLGALLCPAIVLYFLWTHIRGVFTERGWMKEFLIGAVFATGVFLVPVVKSGGFDFALLKMTAAFGALCMLNCLTISYHESRSSTIGLYWIAACLTLLLQGIFWVLLPDYRQYFTALLFGSLFLIGLMLMRHKVASDLVASFADIALLIAGILAWVR